MQKITLFLATSALILSIAALLRPSGLGAALAKENDDPWRGERTYPPLVFSSKAWLDCSISSTKNGRQIMSTVSGQGFTFATPMKPIKDGQVKLKKPGMHYKFNAFPTSAIAASFTGLGAGTITAMKAEIEVDVKRFKQPGGPGTDIQFRAVDMNADAAYVEFTGVFVRKSDRKRFPFRVVFGHVSDGGGRVTPTDRKPDTNIRSKSVVLGTRQNAATVTTALYEAEDDVQPLK